MTYIQFTEHSHLKKYHNDELMPEDYFVKPNDNGVANVKEAVAANLVEAFDHVRYYEGGE